MGLVLVHGGVLGVRGRATLSRACDALARPAVWHVTLVLAIVAVLSADIGAGVPTQLGLGLTCWTLLALGSARLDGDERAQVIAVVCIATIGEVLATRVWGRYEYRLHNLPAYVPPGHGMVYLGGLRFSQWEWVRRNSVRVRTAVGAVLLGWATWGLTGMHHLDVSGAISAVSLLYLFARGRRSLLACGVFLAVALLEIYGTQVGDWTWAATVPGLGISGGNPPSGGAATYVLCDLVAIRIGPRVRARAATLRARLRGKQDPAPIDGL